MCHHLPREEPTREGFLQVLDMLHQEKESNNNNNKASLYKVKNASISSKLQADDYVSCQQ